MPDRSAKALGEAMRERRAELGISQERFAEIAGLHRTYVAAEVVVEVQGDLAVAAAEAVVEPAGSSEAGEKQFGVEVAGDEDLAARQHLDCAQCHVVGGVATLEEDLAAFAEGGIGAAVRPI
jgi:transcriptional regulator with XRE-family HTH domain